MKNTNRLEAFSDGVMAIIITIMVLEINIPENFTLSALLDIWPHILSYLLSFIYVGIYWNNHHHMFHVVKEVNGSVLWANLHLLFWLSLLPLATAWMGENYETALPTAVYGGILFLSATAWWILQQTLLKGAKENTLLAKAVKGGAKEIASIFLYIAGIALAFYKPWLADVIYALVALLWIIPDRRMERILKEKASLTES